MRLTREEINTIWYFANPEEGKKRGRRDFGISEEALRLLKENTSAIITKPNGEEYDSRYEEVELLFNDKDKKAICDCIFEMSNQVFPGVEELFQNMLDYFKTIWL